MTTDSPSVLARIASLFRRTPPAPPRRSAPLRFLPRQKAAPAVTTRTLPPGLRVLAFPRDAAELDADGRILIAKARPAQRFNLGILRPRRGED